MRRTAALSLACLAPLLAGAAAPAGEGAAPAEPWRPKAYKPLFTEAERAKPHVAARTHDLHDFPFLDGQWEGIVCDRDGDVWFAVSSHSDWLHGQIFKYDRRRDQVFHICDLGQVCGEKLTPERATQDKVHCRMWEVGDVIYGGTCEGHTVEGRPYRGGYWLEIDKKTGAVRNLGASLTKDGLICVEWDPYNRLLYAHTNRHGLLSVFDPASGKEEVLGKPWSDVQRDWPRGLTLMIAPDGKVYGGKPPRCTIWQYDPRTRRFENLKLDMPVPKEVREADPNTPQGRKSLEDWDRSAMHMTLWDEKDRCFYFVRSYDMMLMRFFPPTEGKAARVEEVCDFGLPESSQGYRPCPCVLVILGRTVYLTPYTGWGGITHLQSYDLESGRFTDHGPVVVEGGRRVNEVHSMVEGKDGKLYAVAFVFSIENVDPVRPYGVRGDWPFHPRLMIIDPKTDFRVPQE